MKAKSALIASIATVGIASSANAQDFTSGGPTPISTTHDIDIVIGASGIIQDLDISMLWASHIWAGDINASLQHVDTGTTVSIFGHIGGGTFGDSSDLIGNYRFDDEAPAGAAGDFWAAAAAAAAAAPIASGTYRASAVAPNSVNPPQVQTFLSVFDGENIQGTWRLNIVDTFTAGSTGSLTSYTLHMVVPTPGALSLLGLAGVAGLGRRRNRG